VAEQAGRPGLTRLLYAAGLAYCLAFARGRLISAAPEELAARAGHADAGRGEVDSPLRPDLWFTLSSTLKIIG
jgi:hypothetical protein